jgi:FkbM family methyltransferase
MSVREGVTRLSAFLRHGRNVAVSGRYLLWHLRHRNAPNRAAVVGGNSVVVRGFLHGMEVKTYMLIHEFHDMSFVAHFLRPGDVFADVGANVGVYSFAAAAGARCVAFEPDAETAALLRDAAAHNGLNGLIDVREVALGREAGEVAFTTGLDTQNHVTGKVEPGTRSVRMETLDDALAQSPPTMLKLDVEGYEPFILEGGIATLSQPTLQAVLTENRGDVVLRLLGDAGFREVSYDWHLRQVVPVRPHDHMNGLFVRDIAFARQRVASAPKVELLGSRV